MRTTPHLHLLPDSVLDPSPKCPAASYVSPQCSTAISTSACPKLGIFLPPHSGARQRQHPLPVAWQKPCGPCLGASPSSHLFVRASHGHCLCSEADRSYEAPHHCPSHHAISLLGHLLSETPDACQCSLEWVSGVICELLRSSQQGCA